MCGIVGIVKSGQQPFPDSERDLLRNLTGTLANRGPDDSGVFVRGRIGFGHRRLAIRDPHHGPQPWCSPDGNCVLIYNGELYNDGQLRRELMPFRFRTTCDTEVVMASYLRWGRDCVQRLRGMFAFAIYDFRSNQLWLVRDRFGVKPLYYASIGNSFIFASQLATIVAHPKYSKQPDWDVVSHYLSTTRTTLGRRSIYNGIQQLQPAEQLVMDGDRLDRSRYWEYPTEKLSLTYEDAADLLETQLEQSVRTRLASDVPVGMFLSGGVDSSTLATLACRNGNTAKYATCAVADADAEQVSSQNELSFATACADYVGAELRPVHVDSQAYLENWHALVKALRCPLSTPSDVMIYRIAKAAKQHVGVVLGGEGSDELLCGYEIPHWSGNDYDASRADQRESSVKLLASLRRQYGRSSFRSEADHYFALNSLLPTGAKANVLNTSIWNAMDGDVVMLDYYQSIYDSLSGLSTPEKNAILLHHTNLESLLARLDLMTMHAGLEARVPYTDQELVETMFSIPFHYRIDVEHDRSSRFLASADLSLQGRLRSKRILRTVANRMLPSELANRKKASFPTGVQHWFRTAWSGWVSRYLAQSPFAKFLLATDYHDALVLSPARAGMWLWPIVNLALWGDHEFFGYSAA